MEQIVMAALPLLRANARLLVEDPEEADELVESTLQRAMQELGSLTPERYVEEWLLSLLEDQWGSMYRPMVAAQKARALN